MINCFPSSGNSHPFNHGGRHVSRGHAPPAREAALEVRDRARLTVRTADGDQVVISLDAQARLATGLYDNGQTTAQVTAASYTSRVSVAVKRDLSDAEITDLGKLLNSLSQNPDPSSLDSAISSMDTIASFRFRETQSLEFAAR
jgi:hypothetical protein